MVALNTADFDEHVKERAPQVGRALHSLSGERETNARASDVVRNEDPCRVCVAGALVQKLRFLPRTGDVDQERE